MKQSRQLFWVLIIIAVGGSLLSLAAGLSPLQPLFRHYAEQALAPYIQGDVEIGRLYPGVHTLHLKDVTFASRDSLISVEIPEILVNFNLIKLFRRRIFIEKVTCFSPQVSTQFSLETNTGDSNWSLHSIPLAIDIIDGRWEMVLRNKQYKTVLDAMNVSISSPETGNRIAMSATQDGIGQIHGQGSLQDSLQLHFDQLAVNDVFWESWHVQESRFSGTGTLVNGQFAGTINTNVVVENSTVLQQPLEASVQLLYQDKILFANKGLLTCGNSRVEWQGNWHVQKREIFALSSKGVLSFDDMQWFPRLTGTVNFAARGSGHIFDPALEVTAFSNTIQYEQVPLENVHLVGRFKNHQLELSHVEAQYQQNQIQGDGYIQLDQKTLNSSFYVKNPQFADLRIQGIASLQIQGALTKPQIQTTIQADSLFYFDNAFSHLIINAEYDEKIRFNLFSADNLYSFEGILQEPNLLSPIDGKFNLQFPLNQIALLETQPYPLFQNGKLSAEGTFFGTLAAPNLQGDINLSINGATPVLASRFSLISHSLTAFYPAELTINPIEVHDSTDIQLSMDSHILEETVEIHHLSLNDSQFVFQGDFSLHDQNSDLDGQLTFDNFQIHSFLNRIGLPVILAKIPLVMDGDISLFGTLASPLANGQLTMSSRLAEELSPFICQTQFSLALNNLSVHQFLLQQDSLELLQAQGVCKQNGQLNFQLESSGFPIRSLMSAWDIPCGGNLANFEGELLGSFQKPQMQITAKLDSLYYGPWRLDSIMVDLDYRHNKVNISKIEGISPDNWNFLISGVYPLLLEEEKETIFPEIGLDFYGSLANPLEFYLPALRHVENQVELHLFARGTPDGIDFPHGKLILSNTQFEVEGQPAPIHDVEAEISIRNNRIEIDDFTGFIGRGKFEISNELEATGNYTPITWDHLNLGVLQVKTPNRPIEMHIPPYMFSHTKGYFHLSGYHDDPYFRVSGPWHNLHLTGLITMAHLEFQYPVQETNFFRRKNESEEEGANFFSNTTFDFDLRAGKSVRYLFYPVELTVDEGSQIRIYDEPGDGNTQVTGRLTSEKGTFVYLGEEFSVSNASFEFKHFGTQLIELFAQLRNRLDDGTTIYLTISNENNDLFSHRDQEKDFLESLNYQLRSEDPNDDTMEKIIYHMRYGKQYKEIQHDEDYKLSDEAISIFGKQMGNYFLSPFIRPVENRLKRFFRLDMIKFRPGVFTNLFEREIESEDKLPENIEAEEFNTTHFFLKNLQFSVGKYIAEDWFVNYQGVVKEGPKDFSGESLLQLQHNLTVEYTLGWGFKLQYQLRYNTLEKETEQRVFIGKSFSFW